jgi:hypothetical protein
MIPHKLPTSEITPIAVSWKDVTEFDRLNERVSAVSALIGSVIGVREEVVQWCSDDAVPAESERLAWLWVCWPHLDDELQRVATMGLLSDLMTAYRTGAMDRWWDHLIKRRAH